MAPAIFPSNPNALPDAADPERVRVARQRWAEAAEQLDDPGIKAFMDAAPEDAASGRMLDALFGNSPFLTSCALKEPATLRHLIEAGPDRAFRRVLDDLGADAPPDARTDQVMTALRVAKRRAALLIALADIDRAWPVMEVTAALTRLAEETLSVAVAHVLTKAAAKGEFTLPYPDDPARESGFVVIGMGKLGAGELNYSSDIDLIVLFDSERIEYTGNRSLQHCCIRMTQELVKLMEEYTADGYVFRTDLRLRPDPGATPVALSVLAALTYYESVGQNWERAAMIKARAVAGDIAAGERFLKDLRPFVWRRTMDFWAIQDVHSIKRQINAHRGGGCIAVAGHNVKLGRGGIREIEFFAQTQQLIWGGRDPDLRVADTLGALNALVAIEQVLPQEAQELEAAYLYLRTLEHRLQMIDDRQTQELPKEEERLRLVSVFMGHADLDDFKDTLRGHLEAVERHYAQLFEDEPSLSDSGGNLAFTGGEHDPSTLETLADMGFGQPEMMSSTIQTWHRGRYGATRSTRSRELLTELTPTLLEALSRTAEPDRAFVRFDEFLRGLPAGVQLFSLFYSNPGLLALVAEIMGDAPRLAEQLSRKPALLESVLEPGFFDPLPNGDVLREELDGLLAAARDYEEVLDLARRWNGDRKFQVGVQMLRCIVDAEDAGIALSAIAEETLCALLPYVEEDFARNHGRINGSGFAVIAMGKLGGREMTASSDLDLVFVYDVPDPDAVSDGRKELGPNVYYMRFGQRLVNALSALTGEGRLYEIDLRLRPSGNSGPVASSLEAFEKYHDESAWTWERMALTRARVICGPDDLARRLDHAIRERLTQRDDPDALVAAVADMRARMERDKAASSAWDVKMIPGGLVDIEFTAQYLQLRYSDAHPDVLCGNTAGALERLRVAGLLDEADASLLVVSHRLWHALQAMLRLTLSDGFDEAKASQGLKDKLAQAAGSVDFDGLKRQMQSCSTGVRAVFDRLVAEPGRSAAGRGSSEKERNSK